MPFEGDQHDYTLPYPQETFTSPPPLFKMQISECLSLANMIILRRPLSKY